MLGQRPLLRYRRNNANGPQPIRTDGRCPLVGRSVGAGQWQRIDQVAAGSFRDKVPPEIVGSGYVIKSIEAALWAFHDARDSRQAIVRAVNLGNDADTTGAVCGQLAGAYWGESGIAPEWRAGLARKDLTESALDGIVK